MLAAQPLQVRRRALDLVAAGEPVAKSGDQRVAPASLDEPVRHRLRPHGGLERR